MTKNLKIRACFKQKFMKLDMKKLLDSKTVTFGIWDLKNSLGQPGSKRRMRHKCGTLASIFINRTSFSPES